MRTLSTDERDIIAAGGVVHSYVEVTNYDGDWINLGAVVVGTTAFDFYNGGGISDDIDRNTIEFTGTFAREIGNASLVPFRSDSPVNVDASSNYQPALDLHRQWRQWIAVLPLTVSPAPSSYREFAGGSVDRIAIGEDITVTGRGREADLIDAWIPEGRTYASGEMQDIIQEKLDDQMGTGVVPLTVADDPLFVMNPEDQAEGHLFQTLVDMAALAIMRLRYRYDASDVDQLTLYRPSTDLSSPVWEIGPREYTKLDLDLSLADVRNFITVKYSDTNFGTQTVVSPAAEPTTVTAVAGAATFSASPGGAIANGAMIVVDGVGYRVSGYSGGTTATLTGSPTFSGKAWYTSASISRYGLRVLPIDLTGDPQVIDQATAGTIADNVRADWETPPLEHLIEVPNGWFAQLHDVVTLKANGVHYIEDQVGMVTSIQHRFEGGRLITVLGLSGTPKGRYRSWLSIGSGAPRARLVPVVTNLVATATEIFTGPGYSPSVFATATVNLYTQSVTFELSTTIDFAVVLATNSVDVVGDTASYGWAGSGIIDPNVVYYVRATPYSGPISGGAPSGVAGDPVVASTATNKLAPSQADFDEITDIIDDLDTSGAFDPLGAKTVFFGVVEDDQWLALSTIPTADTEVGTEYRRQHFAQGAGQVRVTANVKAKTGSPTIKVKYSTDGFGSVADLASLTPTGTGLQVPVAWTDMPGGAQADIGLGFYVADGADTAALDLYAVEVEFKPGLVTTFRDFSDDFSDDFS